MPTLSITEKTPVPGPADWRWQDAHAIVSPEVLAAWLGLPRRYVSRLDEVIRFQPLKITPYYLSLIQKDNPDCPLRRMVIPDPRELRTASDERADPLDDTGRFQPLPGLTHRYPNRVLLYPVMQCAGYCRYCFRRRRVGGDDAVLPASRLRDALAYIRDRREIAEVIMTGGDPLMLPDDQLLDLARSLRRIMHVRLLRLHTRMPVFNPFRITCRLADGLAALQPLWVVVHFNHPREITTTTVERLGYLRRRGVPLLNQSVLLRGVNDSADVLRELGWRLAEMGVTPYYLHHLDRAHGTRHWRVGLRRGRQICRELRETMPGYIIPRYVRDIPGDVGKTLI